MDRLLFRCGRVLEPGRCRRIRIYDQSPDRALLHAGPEYDSGPRAWRALRCVWNAGTRVAVVLHACDAAGAKVEHEAARLRILGDQHRNADGNTFQLIADRSAADVSIGV